MTSYKGYPTPLEQYQLNPHGFQPGDKVILPNGKAAEIYQTGFEYARFKGRTGGHPLKDLRPYNEAEIGQPLERQLTL